MHRTGQNFRGQLQRLVLFNTVSKSRPIQLQSEQTLLSSDSALGQSRLWQPSRKQRKSLDQEEGYRCANQRASLSDWAAISDSGVKSNFHIQFVF